MAMAFKNCPVCGKQPVVRFYRNYATARCKGYIFHWHPLIEVVADGSEHDDLKSELKNRWNRVRFRESRFLYYREDDISWFMKGQ